ncbi:MAG: cyclic nucleotide-binding domain-containing protein [Verrucomicrobiota bacterium]|nr:cyclic nucleotide-binding domain-containing protein [Verrucomicrobiota bacterium]
MYTAVAMQEEIRFETGETIIKEGTVDSRLYMLQGGVVEIRKGGLKVAEIDAVGTVFGEISAILVRPRTCSAVAKTDCKVLQIGKNIDEIIRGSPILTKMILAELAERLERTTFELAKARAKDLIFAVNQDGEGKRGE